jgi:hypothetical protein
MWLRVMLGSQNRATHFGSIKTIFGRVNFGLTTCLPSCLPGASRGGAQSFTSGGMEVKVSHRGRAVATVVGQMLCATKLLFADLSAKSLSGSSS